MPFKKTLVLDNGEIIVTRDLGSKDTAKKLKDYINAFVDEKAFLLMDKKVTLKEQKGWLKSKRKEIKKHEAIYSVIEHKGRMIGSVSAERKPYKLRNNISLGIALNPAYRGKGIGFFAMRELIKRVQKEMEPKNIFLTVYAKNAHAENLYKKLGFVHQFTRKDWINHYGEYLDEKFLILDAKKFAKLR